MKIRETSMVWGELKGELRFCKCGDVSTEWEMHLCPLTVKYQEIEKVSNPVIHLNLGGRRSGRTTKLIDWLVEGEPDHKRAIVCHSSTEAERIYKIAYEKCDTILPWQIFSYGSHTLRGNSRITELGIDNIDLLLGRIFGMNVSYVVGTKAEDYEFGAHQFGFQLVEDEKTSTS